MPPLFSALIGLFLEIEILCILFGFSCAPWWIIWIPGLPACSENFRLPLHIWQYCNLLYAVLYWWQ